MRAGNEYPGGRCRMRAVVNINDAYISQRLQEFNKLVGFTQSLELDKADARTLAKLAEFVSKSISAQSQSLGKGGPSQSQTMCKTAGPLTPIHGG